MPRIMLPVISIILIGRAIDIVAYSIRSANASGHELLLSSNITNEANENGEAEFQQILDVYESACNNSGAHFDRFKMEEEVKLCKNLRKQEYDQSLAKISMADKFDLLVAYYIVTSGGRLDEFRIDSVKKRFMEPWCRVLSGTLDCLKPYNDQVMEQCGEDGTYAVIMAEYRKQVVEASCGNGGSRVVEFLGNGGLERLKFYSEHGGFGKCIRDPSFQTFFGEYSGEGKTIINASKVLDIFNGCLTTNLDGCTNKVAENSLKAAIAELVAWTSKTCSHAAAKQNRFTFTNTIEL